MAEFSVIRTARRQHRCETRSHACVGAIQPGDRYVYASLPPGGEMGYLGWSHMASCAPCEIAYGRKHADALGGVSEASRCTSQHDGWQCELNTAHVDQGEKHRVGDGGQTTGATW
jgi:hypothetical protein